MPIDSVLISIHLLLFTPCSLNIFRSQEEGTWALNFAKLFEMCKVALYKGWTCDKDVDLSCADLSYEMICYVWEQTSFESGSP